MRVKALFENIKMRENENKECSQEKKNLNKTAGGKLVLLKCNTYTYNGEEKERITVTEKFFCTSKTCLHKRTLKKVN